MTRRYNLSHPAGQPMPEDWIHLPDSVVAAADYDDLTARHEEVCASQIAATRDAESLAARLAEAERDAARYRYMRGVASFRDRNGPGLYWYLPRFLPGGSAEQLDASIDASITAVSADDVINAQHDETGRTWRGPRSQLPSRYFEITSICCLDYPRCDCNSPPEPDNEWHCSQYPGCECFVGCREKALEAAAAAILAEYKE